MVSVSLEGTLTIWDVRAARIEREIDADPGGLSGCDISPDGRWLATSGSDLRLWDLESGEELAAFLGHERALCACGFSPDGRHVASSSHDRRVIVWDVETQRRLVVWSGHGCYVLACAFSPDGRRVAAACGVDWITHKKPRFEGEVRLHRFRRPQEPLLPEPYRRLASLEESDPEGALQELAEQERDNTVPQRDLMAVALVSPILAFLVALWVHRRFGWHPAATTILIWCYLGFGPYAWRYGAWRLEVGASDTQVGCFTRVIMAPLLGFFYNVFVIAALAVAAGAIAWLIHLPMALLLSRVSGVSFGTASDELSHRLGLPLGIACFILVFLVLGSDTPRLLSPKRVLLGLRLNAGELAKFSLWLVMALALGGGVVGFWFENPLQGVALSLVAALLGAIDLARAEKDFELSLLYRLSRVRLLLRTGRELEAEWHLYKLSKDFQKPFFPEAVKALIDGLRMLMGGSEPARIQRHLAEIDVRERPAHLQPIYYDQVRLTLRLARARP